MNFISKMFSQPSRPTLIYAPKEDITAWELAQLMKIHTDFIDKVKLWQTFPPEVKRHCYVRQT